MRAFLKSLDALDEEEGYTILDAADRDHSGGLALDLRLRRTERSRPRRWRVVCESVLEQRLMLGRSWRETGLYQEHTLLWPHHCKSWHLYFRGPVADVFHVIGCLYQAHYKIANRWFPFDLFLNTLVPLPELLGDTGGKLAVGPRPLLAAYAQVLDREGIAHSLLHTPHPPIIAGEPPPQVLLLGEGYVVARRFTAEQLPFPRTDTGHAETEI